MEINELSRIERDKELVLQALSATSTNAFDKLLKHYWRQVYNHIHKMIANDSDAEDLTMETFAKAFGNIHKYNNEYAFSTWLYRIAGNTTIDFLRKNKPEDVFSTFINDTEDAPQHPVALEISLKTSVTLSPEEISINKDASNKLKEVIENLKPAYRDVLMLRFYEELSYDEIATQLNIPINNVKVQLHRAKQSLQKKYTRHHD
jgi:RNA polymerase sigma factor (sigma-70 family)